MQPAPAPSAGRGDAILQPAYFTSVLYVKALRNDILTLTDLFRGEYSKDRGDHATSPFALFKRLWTSEGWKWLHFRVFDDRARETFLLVTIRLFVDQITDRDPLARVVGLFGAFTFYYTQPEDTAPRLRRVNHIPIPIDRFKALAGLCDALSSPELLPLREPVLYISSAMIKDQIFYILPHSDLGPESPRYLPREIVIDSSTGPEPEPEPEGTRKKGRPSRLDKAKKARAALGGLTTWLDSTPSSPSNMSSDFPIAQDDSTQYQTDKAELIAVLEASGNQGAFMEASLRILERLREAQAIQTENDVEGAVDRPKFAGIERVERAVQELGRERAASRGVLGLLEGAGLED